jgi:hypothetical protein
VVVGIALARLAGEGVVDSERFRELLLVADDDPAQGLAVLVAGPLADEVGGVRVGLGRDVAGERQGRDQGPVLDLGLTRDVRDMVHEQMVVLDLDLVALVPKTLQVGTTTYQLLGHRRPCPS